MNEEEKIKKAMMDKSIINEVPEIINTYMSDLFLFKKEVYKYFHKNNEGLNKNFVNLNNKKIRKEYFEKDFRWNNYFSPEIYLALLGVEFNEKNIILTDEYSGDYIIKMKRIDAEKNVFRLLLANKITDEDAKFIGKEFMKKLNSWDETPMPINNFPEFFDDRIVDVEKWLSVLEDYFDKSQLVLIIKNLKIYIKNNKELLNKLLSAEATSVIDSHAENFLYENNKLAFIDVLGAKKEWNTGIYSIMIYRLALEFLVLGSKSLYDNFLEGVSEEHNLNTEIGEFMMVYGAMIKGPYVKSLAQGKKELLEAAEKIKGFILNSSFSKQ